MPDPHIFLSHAVADKPLVDLLVADIIRLGCDVPANRIFCSSLEGMGIETGTSFPDFIRQKIQKTAMVIAVLTPSYMASEFCLCELGAAWAMEHNFFPLIVKPANRSKMKGVLTGIQIEKIEDDAGLDYLRDRIKKSLDCGVSTAQWTSRRDSFLNKLPAILADLTLPATIDRSELETSKAAYDGAVKDLTSKDEEIGRLNTLIEDLKKCKDLAEVSDVLAEHSGESEQFEALVEIAAKTLGQLPYPTQEALFQEHRGQQLCCIGPDPYIERYRADQDVERAYLYQTDNGFYTPRKDHPAVEDAQSAVEAVASFLETASPDFLKTLKNEHRILVELSNRDFWNALFR